MKSPLPSIKKQYHEFRHEFEDMPTWLKVGSYLIMLVGPNTDPTIASGDKTVITNLVLATGAAIMIKKADNHRRARHEALIDARIADISQRTTKVDQQSI